MMPRLATLLTGLCLLPLAGCHHRAPAVFAAPPAPPEIAPVMVSVPPPTHPTEPLPGPPAPVTTTPVAVPAPPKRPHRRKVAPVPVPVPVQPAPTVAAATPPPIELGQLSAGGEAGDSQRGETEALLSAQKQRLARLSPTVTATHAADVDQARRFLKGAEDAWKAGDLEGAHTLAVKAKILVDDLSK